MSEDQGVGTHKEPGADDSYWAALFQTEDIVGEIIPALPDIPFDFGVERPPAIDRDNGAYTVEPPAAQPVESPPAAADPWELAQRYMGEDKILELKVFGHNKGGLLVSWNGVQGFVPASQLIDFPQFHVPRERFQTLSEWHDRILKLKIIEVDKLSSRLILSERATLVAAKQREGLLSGVRAGEEREGTITNLTGFGAFVDLGGVEGLVHISEISWSRVTHPSMLLGPGQAVRVIVLSVDQNAGRVALSMKRLRSDPWLTAAERYQPDQRVQGVIGNITTYGAFVILEEELEGLVHISELAEGVFMHPRDVVRTGEPVVARVLSVDAAHKRIALSLRGTSARPAQRE